MARPTKASRTALKFAVGLYAPLRQSTCEVLPIGKPDVSGPQSQLTPLDDIPGTRKA